LSGVTVDTSIFRPATFIETGNDNLLRVLIVAGVLLLLGSLALLFDRRRAMISLIAIVASLATAGLVLSLFDTTLNSMIIAGLGPGLVVVIDDAVTGVVVLDDGRVAYDVHVWSTPVSRDDPDDVGAMLVDAPGGRRVPLKDVADVQLVPVPNEIHRDSVSRSIDVSANVEGRDLGAVVGELEDRLEEVSFPIGYNAEVQGEFAERQAAQQRLFTYASVAIIGIFLILVTSFASWRLAVIAFVTLPMALVGGVLAAYIGGGIISLGSLVGFFTILGIVARSGIMMVSHYKHLEEEEGMRFGSRTRRARVARATRADLDDRAHHRACARAARHHRRHPRSGDRVPDGDRHPQRPHHVDAAQPLRSPVLLPALRKVLAIHLHPPVT
jgi:Cu/Ag efflux pump CusA